LASPSSGDPAEMAWVVVVGGTAAGLWSVTLSHEGCGSIGTGAESSGPTLGSPVAAWNAWNAGGIPFHSAHALATESVNVGNGSYTFTYSSCGFGSRVTGNSLSIGVNGGSGTTGSPENSDGECQDQVPLPPPDTGPSTSPTIVGTRSTT
jgi:hypothetical protein